MLSVSQIPLRRSKVRFLGESLDLDHPAFTRNLYISVFGGGPVGSDAYDDYRVFVLPDKFDTLLLIIRSTDDKSLVGQAHAAAKTIEDESKKAEALLDVIKEIDYFSNPQQPAA